MAHEPRNPAIAAAGGQKIMCPECGLSGYIGGQWAAKHAEHVTCTCGQRVSARGLGAHRGAKQKHGSPCPS